MKLYEGFFILPPDATNDARKTQITNLETSIQKFGGKIVQRIELGRKPIGYMLKKFREGYQVVVDFEMNPPSVQDLRKVLELQEDTLKYMVTVKVPKPDLPQVAPKTATAPAQHSAPGTYSAPSSRAPRRSPASGKTSEKAPVQ